MKTFKIEGYIDPINMTDDFFVFEICDAFYDRIYHKFMDFIESNAWEFGGGMKTLMPNADLSGCITICEDLSADQFRERFLNHMTDNDVLFKGNIYELNDKA
ncbi:hypothetical protein [Fusibacter ferrireducens]|uniref:Uncharacterized protein n=1 Tax=Fusibacter ferrireducens TaxID=2785058 RepID=A0ABR9ZV13_9FIRM|nr:hypothetical protein [Fusibacter ferrireducens]MBF4693424.1 hypothetical protein [Fusibacter ferrireducens]